MTRTKLRIFFMALTLVLGLYLLPQLPWAQRWLMSRVQGALHNAGYELDYRASGGNLWTQLRFAGVRLEGPGVDVELDELALEYRLWPLLVGRLPLSVRVSKLHGELSLAELDLPSPAAEGPSINLVLEQLAVERATLSLREVPYTLPDLTISEMQVRDSPEGFQLDTTLRTAEGGVILSALIQQDPLILRADIQAADARIARHWWEGVTAGTLSGQLTLEDDQLTADLELQAGQLDFIELRAEAIQGPVRYQDGIVSAELTGEALGGALFARGQVDPGASQWQAEIEGEAQLAEALGWLLDDLLNAPVSAAALEPTGDVQLALELSGWREIALSGRALGEGTLLGEPLEALVAELGFHSGVGVAVSSRADWAKAPVRFSLQPAEDGFELSFDAQGVRPLDTLEAQLTGVLASRAGSLQGEVTLELAGTLAERALSATLIARSGAGLWSLSAHGEDALGAQLTGAATLDNAQLSGALSLSALTLPGALHPIDARLSGAGPLDALPLRLSVGGDQGVRPEFAALAAGLELSGELSATLQRGRLDDIRGALGPLSLQGALELTPLRGKLAFALAETALAGSLDTRVQLEQGQLRLAEEGLVGAAQLTTSTITSAGVNVPGLAAKLELTLADTLSVRLRDEAQGIDAHLEDDQLRLSVQRTPVDALEQRFTLSGNIATSLSEPREALALDLNVAAPQAQVQLRGGLDALELSLVSDPGAQLGGVTLAQTVTLSGRLRSEPLGLSLRGSAGDLAVNLEADLAGLLEDAHSVLVNAELAHAGERLELLVSGALPSPTLHAAGALSLAPIGDLLGTPVTGHIEADLSAQEGRYQGHARLDGRASGQPFYARLDGVGGRLHADLQSPVAGYLLELRGQLLPTLEAELTVAEQLQAVLVGSYPDIRISGSGIIEPDALAEFTPGGLELDALPWQLSGGWAEQRIMLELGDSRMAVSNTESGWRADSNLRQRARWHGLEVELSVLAAVSSRNPAGWLDGALRIRDDTSEETLLLGGTLEALSLSGSLPASVLGGALGGVEVPGRLELNATLDLYAGPHYRASAQWLSQDTLRLELEGQGATFDLSAEAPGLSAALTRRPGTPVTASLSAEDFQPARFAPQGALASLHVNGALEHQAGRYQGELTARRAAPLASRLQLRGEGERLLLEASSDLQGDTHALQFAASGELLPHTALELRASLAERAALTAGLRRQDEGLVLAGELHTDPFVSAERVGLALPATRTHVAAELSDGFRLSLSGEVLNAVLERGVWSGELDLPLALHGEAHALRASLTGQAVQPQLQGDLSGPYLQGPVSANPEGGTFSAALALTPWLPDTPTLDGARARLDAQVSPALRWAFALHAEAQLQAMPLELSGELSGLGTQYEGSGTLQVASAPLDWQLSGEGARAEAQLGVEGLSLATLEVPTALQGALTGSAAVHLDGAETRYSVDVHAEGELQAQPFAVQLRADETRGFTLLGNLAHTQLEAHGPLSTTGEITVTLEQPAHDTQLELLAVLNEAQRTLTLSGEGQYAQEPFTLSGQVDWQTRTGYWRAELAELSLQGELTPHRDAQLHLSSTFNAPQGVATLTSTPLTAQLEAYIGAGLVQLEQLRASAHLEGQTATLELRGAAWPHRELSLSGSLEHGALPEPVSVLARSLGAGYHLTLGHQAFELRAALSPGFAVEHLYAGGSLAFEELWAARAEADLRWSQDEGFRGRAEASAAPFEDAALRLELRGEDDLLLTSHAHYQGAPVATATLRTSRAPWQDERLNGRLRLEADSRQLRAALPSPLQLSGELELNGSLRDPRLSGSLRIAGALSATGSVQASASGARLELLGSGLNLQVEADASGWALTGDADTLAVDDLLPQLEQPRLSATLRAEQAWGGAPRVDLESLTLSAPHSTLSGRAHYQGEFQVSLDAELDARDLDLGSTPLEGQLRGPLSLQRDAAGAVELSGALELHQVRPAAAGGWLSGHAGLSGTLDNPALTLFVAGEGEARGHLEAQTEPQQGRLELQSTLRFGAFSSDLSLTLRDDQLSTQGELAFAEYALALSPESGQRIGLRGSQQLADWHGALDLGASQLWLGGPLARLAEVLEGDAELQLDWAARPRLDVQGQVAQLQVAGLQLGNLQLSSQRDDDTRALPALRLEGEALSALTYLDAGQLHWQLEQSRIPLTSALQLEAQGQGTLEHAALDATLRGVAAGERLELPLEADYRQSHLRVETDTPLLGGHLKGLVYYHPDEGWRGTLEAEQLSVQGAALALTSHLSGSGEAPQLSGQLELAWGETQLAGDFLLSPETLQLEQQLALPMLDGPLQLSGTVWPEPELIIATSEQNRIELSTLDKQVQARGVLELPLGPLNLRVKAEEAPDAWLTLAVRVPWAPGLALASTLPSTAASEVWDRVWQDGLQLVGRDDSEGSLTLHLTDTPALAFEAFRWHAPAGTLSLEGTLVSGAAGLHGAVQGSWQGERRAERLFFPWLAELDEVLPFILEASGRELTLSAENGLGSARARLDTAELSASLRADLQLGEGHAQAELDYNRTRGPSGQLNLSRVPLLEGRGEEAIDLFVDSNVSLTPGGIMGTGGLEVSGRRLNLFGEIGWARLLGNTFASEFFPQGTVQSELQVRASNFELAELPGLGQRLPHLSAPLSGVLQLQGERLVGQFNLPALNVAGTALPARLELSGTLANWELRGTLGRSRVKLDQQGGVLSGLINFELFPLQVLVEAALGRSDVSSSLTAPLRFEVPLGTPQESVVRFATERFQLERGGVSTEGNVALRYEQGRLLIEQAEFRGRGAWQASGQVAADALDLRIEAQDSDFTPLLGLIPAFAAFDVGAQGSFTLTTNGSLEAPRATFESGGFDLQVAGSSYRLTDTRFTLGGGLLRGQAQVNGLEPISGELNVSAEGPLSLLPFDSSGVAVELSGIPERPLHVPLFGDIREIEGRISGDLDAGLPIEAQGTLGNPLSVRGTLAPLDLRLHGDNLVISAPQLFIASSRANAELRVYQQDDTFRVAGEVFASEARLTFSGREIERVETEAAAVPEFYERFIYDNIRIHAPQQVVLRENFGNFDASLNLILAGNLAQPTLSGEARTLRGTIRFSGRDFALRQAVASFDPTRGVFPSVNLVAETSFDKTRALPSSTAQRVDFVEPPGSSFQVILSLEGGFEETTPGLYQLQLNTSLTSNARVDEAGVGSRTLSEDELLTLIALGRLELSPALAGRGGFAGSVAETALSTTVDLFVLSELQSALGDALGLQLFEIRTTPLGSLLAGNGDPFGVSFRLGGYLSDELFATYQIGSTTEVDEPFSIRNELSLRYDLAPLELILTGSLGIADGVTNPALSASLGYSLSATTGLEVGFDLSNLEQRARLGIFYRW